jgi:hypothetical protein
MADRAWIGPKARVPEPKRRAFVPDGFLVVLKAALEAGEGGMNLTKVVIVSVRLINGQALLEQAARIAVAL